MTAYIIARIDVTDLEGRARNVIIRFGDMETAKKFYHSPEYQEALSYGLPAADREYTFVEGV